MEKSPTALKTIGEVAVFIGVATHVLRFWEGKFTQIKPQKRRGRRYYRPEDVDFVMQVKTLLYQQGYTIRGAQKFLMQNQGGAAAIVPEEGVVAEEKTEVQPQVKANENVLPLPPVLERSIKEKMAALAPEDVEALWEVYGNLLEIKEQIQDIEEKQAA